MLLSMTVTDKVRKAGKDHGHNKKMN